MTRDKALLEKIQTATATGRELLAEKTFNQKSVDDLIMKRAVDGFNFLRIEPSRPVPVKDTKAAKNLIRKLEQRGLTCRWDDRQSGTLDKDNRQGETVTFEVLRISW